MSIVRRVLLIEHEKAIRELAQLCLETVASWQVLTAASSSEAMVKAQSEQFDVILLDLDVMLCDREHCILHQLQHHPVTENVPVILLTITPIADLPQFSHLEVKAAIAKPFDLLTLASQIAAVLDWKY